MKKKFLIFTAATVVALMCLIGVAGCKAKDKTFEKEGMQITLTTAFTEKEYISQTAYYESKNALVTVLKEDFATIGSSYTLAEYTNLVLRANRFSSETYQREGQVYMYFTYEKSVSGNNYFYLATTHKGPDAYWLIQFACFSSKKDKYTETFYKWADSVTFLSAASNGTV